MDKRFRRLSFELLIVIGLFFYLFKHDGLSMLFKQDNLSNNLSHPITLVFLALFVAEFIRILAKLRKLRKAGVNVTEQSYRNPFIDTFNPKAGDVVSIFNQARLIWVAIVLIVLSLLLALNII